MNDERLAQLQAKLREHEIDGWLFYDFRRSNPIAYRVLDFAVGLAFTRRWYYWLPAEGDPARLVSAVEPVLLDELPGRKIVYRDRQEMVAGLEEILAGAARVAMEYSPLGELPVVSRVDAGTIELVRSLDKTVVSSADLVQEFEAPLSQRAYETHVEAEQRLELIMAETQAYVRQAIAAGEELDEYSLVRFMLGLYERHELNPGNGPHVAVNANASDPHYEPSATKTAPIREGDLLLIDWWGKLFEPGAVYADYTWMMVVGSSVPERYREVFDVVLGARDAALEYIERNVRAGAAIQGWQVDDVTRAYIAERGYGEYFIHRTGHSIGEEIHGNGTNLDNFETRDTRTLLPRTLFSVEPGIYLPEFGLRSEVDVYIGDGTIEVTGRPVQRELPAILV